MPRRSIRSSKRARSSAMSIASGLGPRVGWVGGWGGGGGGDGKVVDLDPLGDADRPAADDERLLALQRGRLVLLVACAEGGRRACPEGHRRIGAVGGGRLRLELGGAGI